MALSDCSSHCPTLATSPNPSWTPNPASMSDAMLEWQIPKYHLHLPHQSGLLDRIYYRLWQRGEQEAASRQCIRVNNYSNLYMESSGMAQSVGTLFVLAALVQSYIPWTYSSSIGLTENIHFLCVVGGHSACLQIVWLKFCTIHMIYPKTNKKHGMYREWMEHTTKWCYNRHP